MRNQTVSHTRIIETDYFVSHGMGQFLQGHTKYADVDKFYKKFPQRQLEQIASVMPYPENTYWCHMFLWTRDYYREHNRFPHVNKDDALINSLARWRFKQRSNKSLTAKQKTLLDSIHPSWKSTQSDEWEKKFNEAKEFYKKNGRLPGFAEVGSDERKLRSWIDRQRQCRTVETLERLTTALPGWNVTDKDRWFEMLQKVADFHTVNERTPLATNATPKAERSLGDWLKGTRHDFKTKPEKFSTEQIAALNEKLPGWSASYGDHWKVTLKEVADFIRVHNEMPAVKDRGTHACLGKWVQDQRANIDKLSPEQITSLNVSVPYWSETPDEKWQRRLKEFFTHVATYEDFPSENGETKKLGSWYQVQKRDFNKNELSEDRRAALDAAVPFWNDPWMFKLNKAAAYFQKHGRIPAVKDTNDNDRSIGLWVGRQRKSSDLVPEQLSALDQMIPCWRNPRAAKKK